MSRRGETLSRWSGRRALTGELVVDELGEVGVVAPPEEPELPAPRSLVAPPHAQHVGLQAAAEAAQDGVLLRHGEDDGRRGGSLPHEAAPFDASQVRLWGRHTAAAVSASLSNLSVHFLKLSSRKF